MGSVPALQHIHRGASYGSKHTGLYAMLSLTQPFSFIWFVIYLHHDGASRL